MEAANLLVSLSGSSRSSTPSAGAAAAALAFSPPAVSYPGLVSGQAAAGMASPRSLPGSRHNLFMPIVNPGNPAGAAALLDLRWRSPVGSSGSGAAVAGSSNSTASPVPPRFVAKLSHQGLIRPELVRPSSHVTVSSSGNNSSSSNHVQFLPTAATTELISLSNSTTSVGHHHQHHLPPHQQQHQLHLKQEMQPRSGGGEDVAKIIVSVVPGGITTTLSTPRPAAAVSAAGPSGTGTIRPVGRQQQQLVTISPLGTAAAPLPITTFLSNSMVAAAANLGGGTSSPQTITVIPVSNPAAMLPVKPAAATTTGAADILVSTANSPNTVYYVIPQKGVSLTRAAPTALSSPGVNALTAGEPADKTVAIHIPETLVTAASTGNGPPPAAIPLLIKSAGGGQQEVSLSTVQAGSSQHQPTTQVSANFVPTCVPVHFQQPMFIYLVF
jgi:hypothetical protein